MKVFHYTAGAIVSLVLGLLFMIFTLLGTGEPLIRVIFAINSAVFLLHGSYTLLKPSVRLTDDSVLIKNNALIKILSKWKRVNFEDIVELRRVKGSIESRIEIVTRDGSALSIPGGEMFARRFNELYSELERCCIGARLS